MRLGLGLDLSLASAGAGRVDPWTFLLSFFTGNETPGALIPVLAGGVYQDIARTIPAEVGDPVGSWTDYSGRGCHVCAEGDDPEGTDTRGELVELADGRLAVRGDGATTAYYLDGPGGTATIAWAVAACVPAFDTVTRRLVSTRGRIGDSAENSGCEMIGSANDGRISSGAGRSDGGFSVASARPYTADVPFVWSHRLTGTERFTAIDNSAEFNSNVNYVPTTGDTPERVYLFDPKYSGQTSGDMDFIGAFLFGDALSAGQVAAVRRAMASLTAAPLL